MTIVFIFIILSIAAVLESSCTCSGVRTHYSLELIYRSQHKSAQRHGAHCLLSSPTVTASTGCSYSSERGERCEFHNLLLRFAAKTTPFTEAKSEEKTFSVFRFESATNKIVAGESYRGHRACAFLSRNGFYHRDVGSASDRESAVRGTGTILFFPF